MMNKEKNRVGARPYADISTPFIVDEKGAYSEYLLNEPEKIPELSLGATALITDKRNNQPVWSSGRIIGLRAMSPFSPNREFLLYMDEATDPTKILDTIKGPHTHQPMVIRISLDQELYRADPSSGNRFASSAVQRPPSAISRLVFPQILPTEDLEEPSLKEMLNIKNTGLNLGCVGFGNIPYEQDGKFLEYKWDIDKLDNKHMFIVGESGSGKTVFLKNLAYEIKKQNKKTRIILTDVQGDISQLLVDDLVDILQPNGWQKKVKREETKKAIEALQPFQLVIPSIKGGDSFPNLRALEKLAENRGVKVCKIGLRLQDLASPSDVEYLYRVQSEQVAMLLDDEAEEIKNRKDPVSLANLRRRINELLLSSSSRDSITSSNGTPYYRSTGNAALRALKNLENYFDFHQLSLNMSHDPLDCFDSDGTTILFLEHLSDEEKIMWEMQLVRWLYSKKREFGKSYIFFDEAHQFIPRKAPPQGKETFSRLRTKFEQLAREGRKFEISLILGTQSPNDLHPIVPDQCPTRIIMKINQRNAKPAGLSEDLAFIANRFGHGQFWILSPFNDTPDWVRVHSSAPPLPHERMTTFWKKILEKAKTEQ